MIGTNRVHEARQSGKFIGSIRDGKEFFDAYFENNEIVLIGKNGDFTAKVADIVNKPDDYLFTPFLEAYNSYRYDK